MHCKQRVPFLSNHRTESPTGSSSYAGNYRKISRALQSAEGQGSFASDLTLVINGRGAFMSPSANPSFFSSSFPPFGCEPRLHHRLGQATSSLRASVSPAVRYTMVPMLCANPSAHSTCSVSAACYWHCYSWHYCQNCSRRGHELFRGDAAVKESSFGKPNMGNAAR